MVLVPSRCRLGFRVGARVIAGTLDLEMRVLIVEDHELFADALGGVLRKLEGGAEVVARPSAEAAVEALGTLPPFDLVMLDLGLPGRRGSAAFDVVQAAAGGAAIVLVSGAEPGADVVALIRRGARGFLHKRSTVAELTTALRFILDGGSFVPPELLSVSASPEVTFTPRQVVRLLAKGASNKDIAEALGCAEATVRVHVSTIMRLLDVENRTQVATSPIARRLVGES